MANVALSFYPALAHSFVPSTNVCGALSTHLAPGPALGSQGWGGYRMDVVPMPMEGKGFQGRRNSIGRGWGLASGNTESEVRKEPQAELSVFFLGPVLDPHWSSPLMAHPDSQLQLGSKRNCAHCTPGSAVAQLGVRTARGSVGGSVAVWGVWSCHSYTFGQNMWQCCFMAALHNDVGPVSCSLSKNVR